MLRMSSIAKKGGGLAAPILMLLLLSIAACNISKQAQDADVVQQDGDITMAENEAVASDDTVLVENEGDILDDALVSDVDNVDCPPLATAPFPYYKEDGTIHFCRKCDTPTEKDPQCMRNLWEEQNKKLAEDHPEYDCYPYPCEMSNLKPMTRAELDKENAPFSIHECDLMLVPMGWYHDGTHGAVKHWNLSGGIIGFHMTPVSIAPGDYMTGNKAFAYDVEEKRYMALGPVIGDMLSYHHNKLLTLSRDARSLDLSNTYRYLGYYGTDGSYRIVYPKPIYLIAYTPANNENWVFANIQETKGGSYRMMYAKVGEWEWTSLGEGMGYKPDLNGNKLGLYDDNVNGYVCDLSKAPKALSDCFLVNREGEAVRNISFDRNNNALFAYSSDFNRAITLVDTSGPVATYKDVVTDFSADNNAYPYSLVVRQMDGNVILYSEVTGGEGDSSRACFYRIDLKKRYCMKIMEKDNVYKYGYAEFEGKWLLYQRHASTPLVLSDMDCYCEKEGICPFEGMK